MKNLNTINEIITEANNVSELAYSLFGDKGSCVMGMQLLYKGVKVANQSVQGSISTELFFNEVMDRAVQKFGANYNDFVTVHGRMN